MSNRRAGRKSFTQDLQAAAGLENLEPRQMLSADTLPSDGVWLDWGGSPTAALRGSYIISFDGMQPADQAEQFARDVAARLGVSAGNFRSLARGQYATFETDAPINAGLAARLADAMPFVKAIEPNRIYKTMQVPNDPRFQDQWWTQNTGQFTPGAGVGTSGADIKVTQAWDISIGTRNNIVAVIDTGVDLQHPDLIQNLWTNPGEIAGNGLDDDGNGYVDDVHGYDFGDNDSDPDDIAGHGTSCAGIIGAVGNNGQGGTGVNWNVSIMALKIAGGPNQGLSTAAIVSAHDYATMMIGRGTNIVASNNSYGGFSQAQYANAPTGVDAERDAIERFVATGATFVASAGNSSFDNDNPNNTFFPTSYNVPGVIAVAATDNNDQLAGFSNYGVQTVDIGAPGVGIFTTSIGGGYTDSFGGTSAAGPVVAGAVALIKSVKPNATAVEIREAIINGADPVPALQGRVRSGGRLNVLRSLQIIQIDGPVVRSVSPGPVSQQFISGTTTPLSSVTVDFSKDIATGTLSTSAVLLRGAGLDNIFGTSDDFNVPIASVNRDSNDPRRVAIGLNLSGFSPARLPISRYELTLVAGGFLDTSGNFLNGNNVAGTDHVYNFRIAAPTGDNEPNDILTEATPLAFDSNGTARFTGVTLGNGLFGPLDVDLYRLDMPRGGQITAEITAQRLPSGSSLDSVLRVFDANGVELASNDQFYGNDSYVDLFVQTGGTYYVAVSGFGNANYNARVGGSGNTQSQGIYNIRVDTRISNDDVVTSVAYQPATPPPSGTDVFATYDAPDGLTTLIPPNAPSQTRGVTTSFITTTDDREILDVNVRLRLSHSFVGDLIISLIAPNGREVFLSNRRGGAVADTPGSPPTYVFNNVLFDDEAASSITTASAPFTGGVRPESQTPGAQPNALGLLDGQRAGGQWTLKIDDTTTIHTGKLLNWALDITYQNNIFGPFESNDTLNTAKAMTEINGSGAATRTAFLGDGGFGGLDRDIFSFTAATGATLTAAVAPTGAFNSAIRLFDASGNQILVANPGDRASSLIDGYVFNNAGTYFIAVSEGSNVAYDPAVVGTGTTAATTGSYTLTVNVAAGVSDPSQVFVGSPVSVGETTQAVIGATGAGGFTGLKFNGIEFLPTGTQRPQVYFGAVAGGLGFNNGGRNTTTLPFALTNESDPLNFRLTAKGQMRNGLRIEKTMSYGVNDHFIVMDVALTNTTGSSLSAVSWMEGFNPDPGLSLGDGNNSTINDVGTGLPFASARYVNNQFTQGLTVALAAPAADGRARATFVSNLTNPRDSGVIIAQTQVDPNGAVADDQMILTFNIGTLGAGATSSMRYFIFFGNNPTEVNNMYAAMNSGTGTGHLTPTPSTAANDTLSDGSTVPSLPFRVYFPEGATGDKIYTFLPISNPNTQPARVVAIAHYEVGSRDQIIGDVTIAGNSRSGFTLITPDLKTAGQTLVRVPTETDPFVAYAIELRSSLPVAATFSHYDQNLVSGENNFKAAVGESFTSVTNTTWSFGQVERGGGNTNFLVWYNTSGQNSKVDAFFYPLNGGQAYQTTMTLGAFRRGGISVNDALVQRLGQNNDPQIALPDGTYGVVLVSPVQIVASLSHYNGGQGTAEGSVGDVGSGTSSGVIPEGQFGLNGTAEQIGVLNSSATNATVTFSFLYENGSAYRTALAVNARSAATLDVGSLPNFPTGQPYAVFYESTAPVSVSARSNAFQGQFASATAQQAYSWWGFGEGFRPGDNDPNHPGVVEYLRLYNPAGTDTTVEISIAYDGNAGTDVFRRTLSARTVQEFDVHDFVVGARRQTNQWYSITIKAPVPIVSYMGHYDRAFQGAFGTLGTPLGRFNAVT